MKQKHSQSSPAAHPPQQDLPYPSRTASTSLKKKRTQIKADVHLPHIRPHKMRHVPKGQCSHRSINSARKNKAGHQLPHIRHHKTRHISQERHLCPSKNSARKTKLYTSSSPSHNNIPQSKNVHIIITTALQRSTK